MDLNPVVLSIPIYFLLIGIELISEHFSKEKVYRLNDAITNISCGITQQITGVFMKIFSIAGYQYIFEHFALFNISPTWLNLIILFIAVDFCYYWSHRMSHQINLFWGSHVVHHQSEDYNFSVALRQSSFQVIWASFFYLPLAFVGFDTISFITMNALVTVYQFWIHTEKIGKLGAFEYVFNTPSHHRVHHGRDPKYIDKNHAGVFIIWDKLFGTFQQEEEKPTYGITTPVNSWNPVWVNFQHYAAMFKQITTIRSFSDKLKFVFKKPGWLPDYLGGPQKPPKVNRLAYQKFDTKPIRQMNWYALVQYLILLGATALYLFNQESLLFSDKIMVTGLIVLAVVNLGALFERKNWLFVGELLRWSLTIFFTINLSKTLDTQIASMATYATISAGILSLFWLVYVLYLKKSQDQ